MSSGNHTIHDQNQPSSLANGSNPLNGTSVKQKLNRITQREYQVLELLVNGFSAKEIGDRLYVSEHTIVTHRKHLIEKLGAKNTAEMVKNACNLFHFE